MRCRGVVAVRPTVGDVNSSSASSLARDAKDSPVLSVLARGGYAVNGLLHILIGAIAIGVAAGVGARPTGRVRSRPSHCGSLSPRSSSADPTRRNE